MGIGIDIVKNERFISYIDDERKLMKILSKEEIEQLKMFTSSKRKLEFIASRFCVKEAIFKATGEKKAMSEITIVNDLQGKPFVLNNNTIEISISHEKDYSIAIASFK